MCEKRKNLFTKPEKFIVRLENLPWSACHRDILKFFEDVCVSILDGGITIRSKDVFIALKGSDDLSRALLKTGEKIHENKIIITKVNSYQLYQRCHQNIRKALRFTEVPQIEAVSIKRIKPTCILRDECEMFNIFNPEECVLCQPESHVQKNLVLPFKTKRKIKPTHLKDILSNKDVFNDNVENFSTKFIKPSKLDERDQIASAVRIT